MISEIEEKVKAALADIGVTEVSFVVEHPTDKHTSADYFSNVALVAAKQVGDSPQAVAAKIKTALEGKVSQVKAIEVAGPGFLNFYLERSYFSTSLAEVAEAGPGWGVNNSWAGKKVVVEYTDPNPFKEFHIGHLFTNVVGESLARLFEANGAETIRANYQGDVGLHVAHALWGIKKLQAVTGEAKSLTLTPEVLGKAYALGATAYKNEEGSAVEEIRAINKAVYERSDTELNNLYELGRKVSLDYFETIYETVGTKFDEYFFESEAGPRGKALILDHPTVFTDSTGAKIFDGEAHGLHTRVFLNKEGLPTYEAKELALAKIKEERIGTYDHSVISTANEINEYFKVLKLAMSFVYPELARKTEHIGHGMVRLTSGKMSSRTGDVVPALTFIKEVAKTAEQKLSEPNRALATEIAVAAIKYATLKGDIGHDSIFDEDKALSFEGDSGPYLQYTHARICSVLTNAAQAGVGASLQNPPETAYEVEKIIYRYPAVIKTALEERAPHKVTQYLTKLAGEFNSFYAQEKIADSSDQYAPYKAAIAIAVRQTLKNGLWVLGIKAPERM